MKKKEHPQSRTPLSYHRPAGLPGVELLYCGDGGFSMAPHIHDCWVLWLTTGGTERLRYKGAESVLQAENFSLIPPGEVHANSPCGAQRTLLSFYLPDTLLQSFFHEYGGGSALLKQGALLTDARTKQTLARVHAQLRICPEDLNNQSALHFALARILGAYAPAGPQDAPLRPDTGRIRKAKELLRERLAENIGLAELAGHCACSQRHILRLFKAQVGLTPFAYLLELRLEQARERIAAGARLAEAALCCGFADQSHLCRRFKARYGVTPGTYQVQVRPG